MKDARALAWGRFVLGFEGTAPSRFVESFLRAGGAGVILFARNLEAPAQIQELNAALWRMGRGVPPLILVDQEGGPVQRLRQWATPLPPMRTVGRTGDARLARKLGRLVGAELRALGFNVDCAPVLDVDTCPDNPIIGPRAFGAAAELVARMGAAFAKGLHEAGVVACPKHFPGHGDTRLDSHADLPVVGAGRERLEAVELAPFRHVLSTEPVGMVMTAHVVYPALDPALPATLSPAIVDGLLRTELGFDGVAITDDMAMGAIARHFDVEEAVARAFDAGVDVVLWCHDEDVQQRVLDAAVRLVERGEADRARWHRAIRRIHRLRTPLRGRPLPRPEHLEVLACAAHRDLVRRIEARAAEVDAASRSAR